MMDTPQNIHVINANMKHPYIYIYIYIDDRDRKIDVTKCIHTCYLLYDL
jgi:hypothetical protein